MLNTKQLFEYRIRDVHIIRCMAQVKYTCDRNNITVLLYYMDDECKLYDNRMYSPYLFKIARFPYYGGSK